MADRKIEDRKMSDDRTFNVTALMRSFFCLSFFCPPILSILYCNSFHQNSIFNPNWTFLAPKARVDRPNAELLVSPTGRSRFTRLKRLKNSARKLRLAPSFPRNQGTLVFFVRMKSVLA